MLRWFAPRCSCGTPRRRLARLALLTLRRAAIGFAWTGLGTTNCSGPLLDSVRRWSGDLLVEAPCCPRALSPRQPSRSTG